MTITDSLAHGLAGHDLRVLADQCRTTRDGAFHSFQELPSVSTAKGARRQIAQIDDRLASVAWAKATRKDRHGTTASWVIPVATPDCLAVCCVKLTMHAGGDAQLRQWPWMIIDKHAIARSHQRLRETDWAIVQNEMRSVALQTAAVLMLARALKLRQFAIPTVRGLLVGEVAEDVLLAKTYIVPPFSRRWGAVLDAWLRFEQRGSREWSQAIDEAALDHMTPALRDPLSALAEELTALDFLFKDHEPGEDVVGELWNAARAQSKSDSTN